MSNPLDHKRLAVLGAGKMGGILLRAFLDQKLVSPSHVIATVRHAERAAALGQGDWGFASPPITVPRRTARRDPAGGETGADG